MNNMDKDWECGKPKRSNIGWGQAFLTNPTIDPLSLDRYSQGEGRVDTHTLCLPPQESWATYYDTAGGSSQRHPESRRTQGDSSTEAFDKDEGRRVTERIVTRALQIQEREQGEKESQYSEISNVPSRSGSSYALVADITGAVLPERPPPVPARGSLYTHQPEMHIPTQSRLVFRGVTSGEGMAMDALAEEFLGRTPGRGHA